MFIVYPPTTIQTYLHLIVSCLRQTANEKNISHGCQVDGLPYTKLRINPTHHTFSRSHYCTSFGTLKSTVLHFTSFHYHHPPPSPPPSPLPLTLLPLQLLLPLPCLQLLIASYMRSITRISPTQC